MNNNNRVSIQERTRKFAVRIINAYSEIIKTKHFTDPAVILSKQFLRSGTSIGANCAEAKSAQSTRDFIHKYEIALKESQELNYWCQIMIDANIVPLQKFQLLLKENNEISNILAASISSLKKKNF